MVKYTLALLLFCSVVLAHDTNKNLTPVLVFGTGITFSTNSDGSINVNAAGNGSGLSNVWVMTPVQTTILSGTVTTAPKFYPFGATIGAASFQTSAGAFTTPFMGGGYLSNFCGWQQFAANGGTNIPITLCTTNSGSALVASNFFVFNILTTGSALSFNNLTASIQLSNTASLAWEFGMTNTMVIPQTLIFCQWWHQ